MAPSQVIVLIGIRPEEKITAFGPVATGSINAQLALKAAGTIIKLGSIPAPTPAAAKTGMRRAVVAVLLVISVKKVTLKHIKAINITIFIPLNCAKNSPIN